MTSLKLGSEDNICRVYLEVCHGSHSVGRLELELFAKDCPKTVANFCTFIENGKYEGCSFHRLIPGFMIQGGDFVHEDGTGCTSIYDGKQFKDESLHVHSHDRRGKLCMANSGPNTNGCQFYITFRPIPHLNGKHTVFGQTITTNNNNERILHYLENNVPTNTNTNKPKQKVFIQKCGIFLPSSNKQEESLKNASSTLENSNQSKDANHADENQDDNEIDIEEDDNEIDIEEEEEVEEEETGTNKNSKKAGLQKRLQLLRRKMNQSRQLHQKEVRKEAEDIIGMRNKKETKKQSNNNEEDSSLHQQAQESLSIQRNQQLKKERMEYSVKDYHNPEGQLRNYERNVPSLPTNSAKVVDERQGAHRLATELKRRMIKSQNKQTKKRERDFLHNHLADVSHVNQRNKRFNEKINRTYDKHTAEIKQNLERGTAL